MQKILIYAIKKIYKKRINDDNILLLGLFATEALNTALERIADKIDSKINPFTKEVKDLGSVAVFFWIIPVIVWWLFTIIKVIN